MCTEVKILRCLHDDDRRRMSFTSLLKGGTHSWRRLICSRVIWAPVQFNSTWAADDVAAAGNFCGSFMDLTLFSALLAI